MLSSEFLSTLVPYLILALVLTLVIIIVMAMMIRYNRSSRDHHDGYYRDSGGLGSFFGLIFVLFLVGGGAVYSIDHGLPDSITLPIMKGEVGTVSPPEADVPDQEFAKPFTPVPRSGKEEGELSKIDGFDLPDSPPPPKDLIVSNQVEGLLPTVSVKSEQKRLDIYGYQQAAGSSELYAETEALKLQEDYPNARVIFRKDGTSLPYKIILFSGPSREEVLRQVRQRPELDSRNIKSIQPISYP
jgi:hypothetical protein